MPRCACTTRSQATDGSKIRKKAFIIRAQTLNSDRRIWQQNPLSPKCDACLTQRVKVDLGIWNKLTQAVVALAVIAVLLIIGRTYLPLIHQNERMRREIDRLDSEQKKQDETYRQLRAEIEALRNDPKTVERLTREKLGYARTDETVIRFEAASTNPPAR